MVASKSLFLLCAQPRGMMIAAICCQPFHPPAACPTPYTPLGSSAVNLDSGPELSKLLQEQQWSAGVYPALCMWSVFSSIHQVSLGSPDALLA